MGKVRFAGAGALCLVLPLVVACGGRPKAEKLEGRYHIPGHVCGSHGNGWTETPDSDIPVKVSGMENSEYMMVISKTDDYTGTLVWDTPAGIDLFRPKLSSVKATLSALVDEESTGESVPDADDTPQTVEVPDCKATVSSLFEILDERPDNVHFDLILRVTHESVEFSGECGDQGKIQIRNQLIGKSGKFPVAIAPADLNDGIKSVTYNLPGMGGCEGENGVGVFDMDLYTWTDEE